MLTSKASMGLGTQPVNLGPRLVEAGPGVRSLSGGNPERKGLNTAAARQGEAEAGGELRCQSSWLQSSRPHTSPCPGRLGLPSSPEALPGATEGPVGGWVPREALLRMATGRQAALPVRGLGESWGSSSLCSAEPGVSGGNKWGRYPPETSFLSRPQGEVLILTLSSRVSLGALERCAEDGQVSRAGDDPVESIPNLVSLENRSF